LTLLFLHHNDLSGEIPETLGNLINLTSLQANSNELTGCFPNALNSLCSGIAVNFSDNPQLPGGGDFAAFCANGSGDCDTINSLENELEKFEFKFYPNPTSDILILEKKNSEPMMIDVWNTLGQRVKRIYLEDRTVEDISDLENGIYWMSVEGQILGKISKF
jgi:hypothetical protein